MDFDFDESDPHPRCPVCGCFMQVSEERGHDADDFRVTFRCNNTRRSHEEGD